MRRLFHLICVVFVCLLPVYAGAVIDKRPVVLDIGHQYTASGAESPDGKINEYAFWAQYAIEVRKEVEAAGYRPAIYFNQMLGYLSLDLAELADYPFWLASYSSQPNFYYHFDMWQYTNKGLLPGVPGFVDLNLSFRDFSAE